MIYKFPLSLTFEQTIPLPAGSKILHVAVQRGVPTIWADCPPMPPVPTTIRINTTGSEPRGRHIGSFLLDDDNFVGHVYMP